MKNERTKSQPKPETQTRPVPMSEAAAPTPALIARLRAASSVDDAVAILSPSAKPKPKTDGIYELVEFCTAPLPQKRGLSVLVYATAARMNKTFKMADLEAALPEKKSVRYWVNQLVKTGHFRVLEKAEVNA